MLDVEYNITINQKNQEEPGIMPKQPNILMIVTDQEYAHQSLPAGFVLSNRDRIHARGFLSGIFHSYR